MSLLGQNHVRGGLKRWHYWVNLMAVNKGKFGETMYLFEDVVLAFLYVERSLVPVAEALENNSFVVQSNKLKDIIALIVTAYEAGNKGEVQEIMQFTLVPGVKKWKLEIEKIFEFDKFIS